MNRPECCVNCYEGGECTKKTALDHFADEVEASGEAEKHAGASISPPAAGFIRQYIDEGRALLEEAYRFAAVSPRGCENINGALEMLDCIEAMLPDAALSKVQ